MMDSHSTSLASIQPDSGFSCLRTVADHRERQRTQARKAQNQSKENLHLGHTSSGRLMIFHALLNITPPVNVTLTLQRATASC